MRIPLKLRQLKAEMVMKELTLVTVAKEADVPYSTTSQLLSGRMNHPLRLARIRAVIERAPLAK
jgi:predicted transcriptional regulator